MLHIHKSFTRKLAQTRNNNGWAVFGTCLLFGVFLLQRGEIQLHTLLKGENGVGWRAVGRTERVSGKAENAFKHVRRLVHSHLPKVSVQTKFPLIFLPTYLLIIESTY